MSGKNYATDEEKRAELAKLNQLLPADWREVDEEGVAYRVKFECSNFGAVPGLDLYIAQQWDGWAGDWVWYVAVRLSDHNVAEFFAANPAAMVDKLPAAIAEGAPDDFPWLAEWAESWAYTAQRVPRPRLSMALENALTARPAPEQARALLHVFEVVTGRKNGPLQADLLALALAVDHEDTEMFRAAARAWWDAQPEDLDEVAALVDDLDAPAS